MSTNNCYQLLAPPWNFKCSVLPAMIAELCFNPSDAPYSILFFPASIKALLYRGTSCLLKQELDSPAAQTALQQQLGLIGSALYQAADSIKPDRIQQSLKETAQFQLPEDTGHKEALSRSVPDDNEVVSIKKVMEAVQHVRSLHHSIIDSRIYLTYSSVNFEPISEPLPEQVTATLLLATQLNSARLNLPVPAGEVSAYIAGNALSRIEQRKSVQMMYEYLPSSERELWLGLRKLTEDIMRACWTSLTLKRTSNGGVALGSELHEGFVADFQHLVSDAAPFAGHDILREVLGLSLNLPSSKEYRRPALSELTLKLIHTWFAHRRVLHTLTTGKFTDESYPGVEKTKEKLEVSSDNTLGIIQMLEVLRGSAAVERAKRLEEYLCGELFESCEPDDDCIFQLHPDYIRCAHLIENKDVSKGYSIGKSVIDALLPAVPHFIQSAPFRISDESCLPFRSTTTSEDSLKIHTGSIVSASFCRAMTKVAPFLHDIAQILSLDTRRFRAVADARCMLDHPGDMFLVKLSQVVDTRQYAGSFYVSSAVETHALLTHINEAPFAVANHLDRTRHHHQAGHSTTPYNEGSRRIRHSPLW